MPPENITTAGGVPRERPEAQGILLKHMSQLNQRLLGPWENADGQRLPRLTMAEAVAQLYEWSTEYRDHPELARDFAHSIGFRNWPTINSRFTYIQG